MEMNFVMGSELNPEDQKHVLSAFAHRFTAEHKPRWANEPRHDGTPYKPQFRSDSDWLQNTSFAVRKDGRLDRRSKYCCSKPTWPEGE